MTLPADAISVKPGGEKKKLNISGGITTKGDNVHFYHVEGDIVRKLNISGDLTANGNNPFEISITNIDASPLTNVSAILKGL